MPYRERSYPYILVQIYMVKLVLKLFISPILKFYVDNITTPKPGALTLKREVSLSHNIKDKV